LNIDRLPGNHTDSFSYAMADEDNSTAASTLTVTPGTSSSTQSTSLDGSAGNDHLNGDGHDNAISGNGGNDILYGNAGNDTLTGAAGTDALYGGTGNDTLAAGGANDILDGGAGNDTLTGGAGADVFAWHLADKGSSGAPAIDTITDFNVAAPASGGDLLEIRDLLQGENSGNLERFLDFDTTSTPGSTIIHVSTAGAFPTGSAWTAGQAASEDQRIVLQGVDLRSAFGLGAGATDNQVIAELLNRGKLITDGP
jgi:Ca2+-binding RTX toxin-like protein